MVCINYNRLARYKKIIIPIPLICFFRTFVVHYPLFFVIKMKEYSWQKKLALEDYYLSPEGYVIFTEHYHLKRGYCCQNACKHCPYGFKKGDFKSKKD